MKAQRRSATRPLASAIAISDGADQSFTKSHHHHHKPSSYRPGDRRRLLSLILLATTCAAYLFFLPIHEQAHVLNSQVRAPGNTLLWKESLMQHGEKECTVWIAPTSLKGVDGFGLYTTRDIAANEPILRAGADGLAIPIEQPYLKQTPNKQEKRSWRHRWMDFWYARGVPGHVSYESLPEPNVDFQVGIGSMPNHHCILSYMDARYPTVPYDDSLVNRFQDSGAGAFSYNRGREFFVDTNVSAGDEIFLNYGYCTKQATTDGWTRNILITDDFTKAAQLMYRENSLLYDSSGQLVVSEDVSEHVAAILPATLEQHRFVTKGNPSVKEVIRRLALNSLNRRTPEWIREKGVCMENVLAKKSTIRGAGQGAFAQRTLRKGEIVTPAPLMHIMDKKALNFYNENDELESIQLVMNYCFGHNRTSLLLCPTTNAALVNHCSTRTQECGPRGPNAEVRWAQGGWDRTSDTWRQKTMEELAATEGHGLAFEIIATRDIAPGEEVFIDYGIDWEDAWQRHVETWSPPEMPSGPWISAKEANEDEGPVPSFLVSDDLRKDAQHPYLFAGCQFWPTDFDSTAVFRETGVNWKRLSDNELLRKYSTDGSMYGSRTRNEYSHHYDFSYWPCNVVRQDGDGTYTVRIHQSPFLDEEPWHKNKLPRYLTKYPRMAIHYFVLPFESDQHLKGVFRHPIGMKDELLPEHWKNL